MIKRAVTRTSQTNPMVTFSVGALTVRRGDAPAEFAERERYGILRRHSAQRHMHLEIRGGPFAVLPRRGRNPNVRRVSTLM
jgi:hypothetical protein